MGRPRARVSIGIALVSALAGCQQTKSVDYYIAHRQEAQETVSRCLTQQKIVDDCGNAGVALSRLMKQDVETRRAADIMDTENHVRPTFRGE
jgi:hypothetical protein